MAPGHAACVKALLALSAGLAAACAPPTAEKAGSSENAPNVLFYSDLGPSELDVSWYPEAQRRNYRTFLQACSRCHTPARAVNAPALGGAFWGFYLGEMRARSRLQGIPDLDPKESEAILSFLAFDEAERKSKDLGGFEARQEELKRRFETAQEKRPPPRSPAP